MQQTKKKRITASEYFRMEENAEYKSEYFNGEVFAMTGASFNHNKIAVNLIAELSRSLSGSDCHVFSSDMKVQVDRDKHYTYPDVSVACEEIKFAEGRDDTILNPVVIFEILSDSTKDYDRGSKFAAYRKIPSLADYILVNQYDVLVEHFFKISANEWGLRLCQNMSDSFSIRSLDIELRLKTVYHQMKW